MCVGGLFTAGLPPSQPSPLVEATKRHEITTSHNNNNKKEEEGKSLTCLWTESTVVKTAAIKEHHLKRAKRGSALLCLRVAAVDAIESWA